MASWPREFAEQAYDKIEEEAMLPTLEVHLRMELWECACQVKTPGPPVRCESQMPDSVPPKLCFFAQHSGSPALAQAGPTKICLLSPLWEDSGSTAGDTIVSVPGLKA